MRGLLLLAIAGCYSPAGVAPCTISCATNDDCTDGLACFEGSCKTQSGTCGADAAPDVPDGAMSCFGRSGGLYSICVADKPTGLVNIVDPFNTDTEMVCLAQEPAACVVIADQITVGTVVAPLGSRPLVLIGATSITVTQNGVIDVASKITRGKPGAGARGTCGQLIDGADVAGGSPGGAGGSFGGLGGQAGAGGSNGGVGPSPVAGAVDALEGGCPGGRGGAGGTAGMTAQAPGGRGGGAIYMISAKIQIDGTINASGEGGAGGVGSRAGGGGGGSGGLIGLDAPTLVFGTTALMFANGGGGGEGGENGAGGNRGDDPIGVGPALGGSGKTAGGDGGAGSEILGTGLPGSSSNALNLGGGGGGGGGGAILFVATEGMPMCPACSPTPKQTQ